MDEFLVWSEQTPGRFELHGGHVVVLQSERSIHADVKFAVQTALKSAIAAARVPCRMLPDGMTVRIDAETAYEPDALVYCGDRLDPNATEVPAPVVVVEVVSPSTGNVDRGDKLINYFRVASVAHYLIIDPNKLPIVHHARQSDGTILTRLVHSGSIAMNPPGIAFAVDHLLD